MAAVATKKRENIHTDIGMVGRKTGFTAKHNLQRDDDGMESLSAFFSSPSTSSETPYQPELDNVDAHEQFDIEVDEPSLAGEPDPQDARRQSPSVCLSLADQTYQSLNTGSISMDMDESSGRSLATVLASRRERQTPTSVRRAGISSPAKRLSMVTGTPRHTIAPLSISPRRPPSQRYNVPKSPSRTAGPKGQSLRDDESEDDLASSKENFPRPRDGNRPEPSNLVSKQHSILASGLRTSGRSNRLVAQTRTQQRSIFTLVQDADADAEQEQGSELGSPLEESDVKAVPSSTTKFGGKHARLLKQTLEVSGGMGNTPVRRDLDAETNQSPASLPISTTELKDKKKRGRKPNSITKKPPISSQGKNHVPTAEDPKELESSDDVAGNVPLSTTKETRLVQTHDSQKRRSNSTIKQQPPKTGRPPKSNNGYDDETSIKHTLYENIVSSPKGDPNVRKRGRKRKAQPHDSDPKEAVESKRVNIGDVIIEELGVPKVGRLQNNQNSEAPINIENPPEEISAQKPKRTRIAPLQFWKNEKRVYTVDERRKSGTAITLKEHIVRVEDSAATSGKRKSRARKRMTTPTVAKAQQQRLLKKQEKDLNENIDESDSNEENDEDDWEVTGKLVGMVKQWPSDEGERDEIEDEIATSHRGIEFKPIFGSDYLFAKTLGKEFMGCGILELRTGATKKLKSSGKMQLVFYLLQGRVEAEVNELGFRIGKDGQFQVPRGNMYKISNPFKKTAKIFFAQACIPDPARD